MSYKSIDNEDKKRRAEKLAEALYYLLEGKSQRQTAILIGISPKTLCLWLKESPKFKEKISAVRAKEIENPFKMGDSVAAFKAFARVHFPEQYPIINEVETKFKKHLNTKRKPL